MIHVVLGPDALMARSAARDIVIASDPTGENTTHIDGKSATISDVLMAAVSIGFFPGGRTVVVEDLLSKHGKGNDGDWKRLLQGVPESTTLVLLDRSLTGIPAGLKKLLPTPASVVVSDPPRGRALIDWIRDRVRSDGSDIDPQTATFLATTLFPGSWNEKNRNPAFDRPPDMDALGNELGKLVTAALPGPVRREHITDLTDISENESIFAFIDAVLAGNLDRAVLTLAALLASGEDPHRILAQLASSIELAAVMDKAGGRDPSTVGRELKLSNPLRMSAIARTMRNASPGSAFCALAVIEDTDRGIKTGVYRDPIDALMAAIGRVMTGAPLNRL